jgi:hypothetical protein
VRDHCVLLLSQDAITSVLFATHFCSITIVCSIMFSMVSYYYSCYLYSLHVLRADRGFFYLHCMDSWIDGLPWEKAIIEGPICGFLASSISSTPSTHLYMFARRWQEGKAVVILGSLGCTLV